MSDDPLFEADDAATPLTADEKLGLIPTYITLRSELNEAEQINVTTAEQAAFARKRNVLDQHYLCLLHRSVFRDVWKWAGEFRKSERNIGVDHFRISVELRELLDNVKYWIAHKTYPVDEIAARFHHKLVWIHCFPNGNGRHARLAADLLLVSLGQPRFTWGRQSLFDSDETRKRYVAALRAADNHDMRPLLEFVRS
jgi:Fic-DOC domain mobile mystery protein B